MLRSTGWGKHARHATARWVLELEYPSTIESALMRASKASWRVSDYAEARLVKGSLRIPVRSTHLQTACARLSLWNPVRHSREEPVGEAGVIGDKQAESEADHSRRDSQGATEVCKAVAGPSERDRDGSGHQDHPDYRANTEDEKVPDAPPRILDGSKNQQRNRGRSGEAVHDANDERSHELAGMESAEMTVEPVRVLMRRASSQIGRTKQSHQS